MISNYTLFDSMNRRISKEAAKGNQSALRYIRDESKTFERKRDENNKNPKIYSAFNRKADTRGFLLRVGQRHKGHMADPEFYREQARRAKTGEDK